MDTQRNDINLKMRSMPWYQDWFRSKGLDPNRVQLNDQQRAELTALAQKNGVPLSKDNVIDKAGNVNIHHGFQGQPGWLKGLEIAGAAAGGALLGGPAIMGLLGHAAPVAGTAGTAAGTGGIATGAGTLSSLPAITSLTGAPIAAAGGTGAGLSVGSGLASTLGAGAGGIGGAAGATGAALSGGNIVSKMMSKVPGAQDAADIGSLLESYGNSQATNRQTEGNFTQNYDQLKLAADANRRANEEDAMQKLMHTSYILGNNSDYKPPTVHDSQGDHTLTDFGFGPKASTEAEKAGAKTLQDQLLERLKPGGSYEPKPLEDYSQPGVGEKVGQWGSLGLAGLGLAKNIWGK